MSGISGIVRSSVASSDCYVSPLARGPADVRVQVRWDEIWGIPIHYASALRPNHRTLTEP